MNELNLVEILKDCPKGTKLYSPLYGEVIFQHIDYDSKYLPIVVLWDYTTCHFTMDGRTDPSINNQECMLFPSKEVRNWDNFKPKKPKFDPKTLHPFDKVITKISGYPWKCDIFSYYVGRENKSIECYCTSEDYDYDKCIPYNEETKHLVGTTEEAPEFYRYWED